jgi:DNA-binding LacI/PurR family transcriptional regulator
MRRNDLAPTLNDVAGMAGVSRQTVSRYLNARGSVAAKTSQRIEDAVRSLGYHPSAAARSLRNKRTMTVGLALYCAQDLSMGQSELFALKLSGLLEVLSPRGYGLQVVETNPDVRHSRKGTYYLDKICAGQLDGLIVSDFYLPTNDILALRDLGIPFAVIDRLIPEIPGRCAMTDVYLEGFRLTTALLEKGHREFAYCGWPPGRGLAHRFREGMLQAIAEEGNGAAVTVDVHPGSDGTYGMMDRLSAALSRAHAPTAAVCSDDWITGIVALLAERGVPSADNFQLAGVSLRPDFLDAKRVALVATPMDRQLGVAGARLLLSLIHGEPERTQPVNVGVARFIAPSFPFLVHPKRSHTDR